MEDGRVMIGSKSDPSYTGEGFARDGQDGTTAPEAPELIRSGGGFRVDRLAMEKRVASELAKIMNEKMSPYKTYLKESLFPTLTFLLSMYGLGLSFTSYPLSTLLKDIPVVNLIILILSTLIFLISFLYLGVKNLFLPLGIYRLCQAIKIYGQVKEGLYIEAINSQTELTSLREEFDRGVKSILDKKALEKKLNEEKEKGEGIMRERIFLGKF